MRRTKAIKIRWSSQQKLRPRYRDHTLRKTVREATTVKVPMMARTSGCRLSTIVLLVFVASVVRLWIAQSVGAQ